MQTKPVSMETWKSLLFVEIGIIINSIILVKFDDDDDDDGEENQSFQK